MEVNYDGSVTVTLRPKNEKVKRVMRMLHWLRWWGMVYECPGDLINAAFSFVKISVNIEKRKRRLLQKEMLCPNCRVPLGGESDDIDVTRRCSRCGYVFKASLVWW
jgi:hypothetical protein